MIYQSIYPGNYPIYMRRERRTEGNQTPEIKKNKKEIEDQMNKL